MPFGIEMHHLYMFALMALVFMIGFVVLAGPNTGTKLFLVSACSPFIAVLVDVRLIPYSFWTIDDQTNAGIFILGCVAYFIIMIVGVVAGILWRNHKHFNHAAMRTD